MALLGWRLSQNKNLSEISHGFSCFAEAGIIDLARMVKISCVVEDLRDKEDTWGYDYQNKHAGDYVVIGRFPNFDLCSSTKPSLAHYPLEHIICNQDFLYDKFERFECGALLDLDLDQWPVVDLPTTDIKAVQKTVEQWAMIKAAQVNCVRCEPEEMVQCQAIVDQLLKDAEWMDTLDIEIEVQEQIVATKKMWWDSSLDRGVKAGITHGIAKYESLMFKIEEDRLTLLKGRKHVLVSLRTIAG